MRRMPISLPQSNRRRNGETARVAMRILTVQVPTWWIACVQGLEPSWCIQAA